MNVRHPGCLTLISYQKYKCGDILSSSPTLMMMMIMMMDYPLFLWHRWPTKGVSSQDYCWSFSPSQISNTPQASNKSRTGVEPAQNVRSGFVFRIMKLYFIEKRNRKTQFVQNKWGHFYFKWDKSCHISTEDFEEYHFRKERASHRLNLPYGPIYQDQW